MNILSADNGLEKVVDTVVSGNADSITTENNNKKGAEDMAKKIKVDESVYSKVGAKGSEVEVENKKTELSVPPVPMTNQTLYSEEEMLELSMGRPNYLSILAQRYKEKPSRVLTGIPELDLVTGGGWVNNGLSVVAAMPNIGKTTILVQSAVAMAQQGTAVVFMTNDMRKAEIEAKIISQLSYQLKGEECLRLSDITNNDALSLETEHNKQLAERLEKTLKYLHIRDLIYDEDFDKGCEKDISLVDKTKWERVLEKYTTVYKKVIFIVDSLQQVASYTDTGKSGVDTILRTFKEYSAKAPIVMVSTLNRSGYEKQEGEINFNNLKESGALEYNTDLLVTMVPLCFIDKSLNQDLKAFKSKEYRDVYIACKKSRDSKEVNKTMTLYAPGCTFIHYEENGTDKTDNTDNTDNTDSNSKGKKSSGKNDRLPPSESLDWGTLSVGA